MATINSIQIAVTNEGLQDIARMVAEGTTFTISLFRITNLGDADFFEQKKSYRGVLDPESYYMDYTAEEFQDDRGSGAIDLSSYGLSTSDPLDANAVGFITINSVELLSDNLTVEINCYIPPISGNTFTCNEIMVYTGEGTLANPYKSFIWGIFPPITKQEQYGLNLRVLCQF